MIIFFNFKYTVYVINYVIVENPNERKANSSKTENMNSMHSLNLIEAIVLSLWVMDFF